MYSKFKINNNSFDFITFNDLDKTTGKNVARKFKKKVNDRLNIKFKDGEIIDGIATKEEWFPQIDCDIFLSHSHKDLDQAYKLSGWLKNKFDLDVFIDSNIWGNINDLLKSIDNEYCYSKKTNTYSYEKRNITTSHVHMMLINSLAEMMNKTESLMFFETPNSIKLKQMLHKVETASPWIYSELVLSSLIKKEEPKRVLDVLRAEKRLFALNESKSLDKKIEITYTTDTSHLINLSNRDLIDWKIFCQNANNFHPLDALYAIKNLKNERK